jgi:Ca2+-binding RTX toxin-like protein
MDTITDFAKGSDKIQLTASIFTAIGSLGQFSSGDVRFYAASGATSAHDANDRIIYNSNTKNGGALYYDADGAGGVAAVQIGVLGGHPTLVATDFVIV